MSERAPTHGHTEPADACWHPVPSWPDPPAPFLPWLRAPSPGLALRPGDGAARSARLLSALRWPRPDPLGVGFLLEPPAPPVAAAPVQR